MCSLRSGKMGNVPAIIFCQRITDLVKTKGLHRFFYSWLLLCAVQAEAVEYTVTAEYRAESGAARFVNTTVNTGVCAVAPSYCAGGFVGSFKTPISAIAINGLIQIEMAVNPRLAPYFMVPGAFRSVTLTNETTGSTREVNFKVAGFGGTYVLSWPVSGNQGHNDLWWHSGNNRTGWGTAPPPCHSGRSGSYTNTDYNFFWKTPSEPEACYKGAHRDIPGPFKYKDFEFSYAMQVTNSLGMDPGVYKGRVTYSIGPGGDFDFGDRMIASDNVIAINFEFLVKSSLKVDFPPGSSRAILQPLRGWRSWLNSGRNPPALSANHDFKISGGGPFKVYLRCDVQVGVTCGMQGQGAASKGILIVPVDIAVSFPPGILRVPGNLPAIRVPLMSGVENAVTFNIGALQRLQSAKMHYDVAAENTALMVKSPGSTYQGAATIIFDAAL